MRTMTSPTLMYASPDGHHTPVGSPAPSQILLQRVASPNHLASQQQQHTYVDSPRSVPIDYTQYHTPQEQQHFEYDQSQELYTHDEHIYDFGPNGALPVDPQFMSQQMHPENNNLMFMPSVQIQPPTPMHNQFNHLHHERQSMTPFSDDGSEFTMESTPDLNSHLIDISTSGYALPTSHYMGLPRSHPMQGRTYYDTPVFDDSEYDSRSPSPSGLREQVKRPLNAFMLYRKDKQNEIPTSNHQSVSRIIGAMWKSESAETKSKYNTLAQKEREKHRLAYPGYKYSPKKRINKDKKVRRTMSQAAHAKRQEEEKQILKQINKRSKSEGTLAKPLPEFLPLPKSKQPSVAPEDQKSNAGTPAPEMNSERMARPMPLRSHSAQPPTSQDYMKFTSNPQLSFEQSEDLNIPQSFGPGQFPEQYEPYFAYPPVEYINAHPDNIADSPFSEASFTDFSADGQVVCSPSVDSFTQFDEAQIYGAAFNHREDMDIFRMASPFAAEQMEQSKEGSYEMSDARIQNVFAQQWSRESTVNPQDLLAQPDNS